jgi:hypothetical protein
MYARTSLFAALAVALVGLSADPTLAAEVTYTATLTGAEDVPDPVKTSAQGELQLVVSADGRSIRYVLTVKDILNPTAGDLHLGPAGANGPLVVKLFPVGGAVAKKGPFSGVLAQGTIDAGDLIGPLQGEKLAALLDEIGDGNAYVNVHTSDGVDPPNTGPGDYPLGEIRGQIVKQ